MQSGSRQELVDGDGGGRRAEAEAMMAAPHRV